MDVFIISCLFFLILLITVIVIPPRINKNLPPGPKSLPIIGNLLDIGNKPHESLAKLSGTYGPIMSLKLGQVTAVVVSSSASAKEVLQTHDQSFSNRPVIDAVQACKHGEFGMPWIPASNLWRNLRKITNSHLFSGKVLNANMNLRHIKLQDLLHEVKKCGEAGEAVDIGKAAFKTILNLLSTTFFSIDFADLSNSDNNKNDFEEKIKETVWSIMEEVGKTNLADYFPLLKRIDPQGIRRRTTIHIKVFFDLFDRIIDRKLRLRASNGSDSTKRNDILDILVEMMIISEENTKDQWLDRNMIKHLLLDLFLAGTETTSGTAEWAMAELLKNPEILLKAKEEVERVVGKGNLVQESDITRLPYLQSVVKETLRLHPPLPLVPRGALSEVNVQGYMVPEGAKVLVNVWAIGRDPNVWDNPVKFAPERFLVPKNNSNDGNYGDVRGRNYEDIQFGGGRRICPGLTLAMRMLHLMLGSLILSFDWKLVDGVSPESLDMEEKFGLSLQRARPLQALPIVLC